MRFENRMIPNGALSGYRQVGLLKASLVAEGSNKVTQNVFFFNRFAAFISYIANIVKRCSIMVNIVK